jgi:2-polyprenyl-3-methyl-5-hydroxy-6-metoxy-1,4-benzoquinol methylase
VADLQPEIRQGHYAQKQIYSRARLVAWSHRRRFETALELARGCAGKRLADYGCGDATFLALLMGQAFAPASAVGVEIDPAVVGDCRRRFHDEPRLSFVLTNELDSPDHRGRYDAVFCMEVLEHVIDTEPLLGRMESLLTPGGRLIISVPVETGLPLVAKQMVRRLAGWRGIGHYPGTTSYRPAELITGVFAGRRQHLTRPTYDLGSGPFHDHKGFNWMVFHDTLARAFEVERTLASPLRWLGPHLATQVWFIARRKPGSSS